MSKEPKYKIACISCKDGTVYAERHSEGFDWVCVFSNHNAYEAEEGMAGYLDSIEAEVEEVDEPNKFVKDFITK